MTSLLVPPPTLPTSPPPPHPGAIRFIDEDRGSVEVRQADEVPDRVKYALQDGQYVPVTEVRAHRAGSQRTIHSFGADGTLLGWNVMVKERDAKAAGGESAEDARSRNRIACTACGSTLPPEAEHCGRCGQLVARRPEPTTTDQQA